MPLDTIYLTRHGHRMNWTIDHTTGTYHSNFPTPTGNPADPTLTAHGVRQSQELAAHLASEGFAPKPWRIYCSPFYRCLQTIQPGVEALKEGNRRISSDDDGDDDDDNEGVDPDVRIENGLGEWFGSSSFFEHPSPASASTLQTHFPTILSHKHPQEQHYYTPHVIPSNHGETISQLHNRVATTLAAIIADVDAEIDAWEASSRSPPASSRRATSNAILICSHAAPLIAMGRVLTGDMPEDVNEEDFNVFTAGLSTFVRRRKPSSASTSTSTSTAEDDGRHHLLSPGTKLNPPRLPVPDWTGGKGVGGGWDCVANGDCSFLSGGAERGWHFNGEESFDTGLMGWTTINPVPVPVSVSSNENHTHNSDIKVTNSGPAKL